jgi:hypothetical protein
LLVWLVWFDLLFGLVASSVLSFSCAVDFGCCSIARLRFAYSDCAFILILVPNPVLRANSFLIAIQS